ncbi:MAG: hypothetical protein DDG60_15080 [Anaerolineae bacterium]|nr:MAG: hypothetical protein DDG60_15080 [Anaerolineae bacterium]
MKKLAAFCGLSAFLVVVVAADRGAIPTWLRALYDFPGGDLLGHFLVYGALTFLLARAFTRRLYIGAFSLAITSLGLLGLALMEEISQFFFPLRSPGLLDLSCGLLGIVLADWLAGQ